MRIPDDYGGNVELYTADDGSVRARMDNPASGASLQASQLMGTASQIYKDEGSELEEFHKATIREIRKRYENSWGGNIRTAWAIRRYEQEVLYPFHRRLQEAQANRIIDAGHFTYTVAKQAAQMQADHILKRVDLINQMELAPLQRELQLFHAETDLSIKAKYQELEDERLDKELDRLMEIKSAEWAANERLERIRQDGAIKLANIQANSEFRIQQLKSSTDIEIRTIETISERKARLEEQALERERQDREDRRLREEREYQNIRDARNMAKQIPAFEAAVNLLKAEGPEEIAAAAARVFSAFISDNTALMNAPRELQPAVADRMLNNSDLLLNHYLTGKFAPKKQ